MSRSPVKKRAALAAVLWLLLLRGYSTRGVRPPRYPLVLRGWVAGGGSLTLPRYPTPLPYPEERRLANKGEA